MGARRRGGFALGSVGAQLGSVNAQLGAAPMSAPLVAYTLSADAGAFTITGTPATLIYTPVLVPVPAGSVFPLHLMPRPRRALKHYTLTARPGAFRITGTPATLRVSRMLAGAAAETPTAPAFANLTVGRRLVAESGAFTLEGGSATFTVTPAPLPIAVPAQKAPPKPRRAAVGVSVLAASIEPTTLEFAPPDAIDAAWMALQKQIDEEDELLLLLGVLDS